MRDSADAMSLCHATRVLAPRLLAAGLVLAGIAPPARCTEEPPAWAYPMKRPDYQPAPDDGTLRRVPGSIAAFTLTQLRDLFLAPDWHPDDHAPMPDVVARGRRPEVYACGFCHRAEGSGGPENSRLAGRSPSYVVRQLWDFRHGARAGAGSALMRPTVEKLTLDDMIALAAYLASLAP